MLRIVCLLSLVLSAYTASAPFIKPCKTEDSACIKNTVVAAMPFFAAGVPELGIKPMDPMKIALVKSDQGGLKIMFKDTTLTGLKDCNIDSIKHDAAKMKQFVNLKCNLVLTGDYKIDGQILILNAQGEGKYKIEIRDMVLKATVDLETVTGKDGKPHWHITKWHQTSKVLTGASFVLENLFNGNKVLAQPVLDLINTSWKDVMEEIAPPIVNAFIGEVVKGAEALYKAVPSEELHL